MYRERPLLGFALIKSEVEKRLQRFSFIGDARKSCALLGFASSYKFLISDSERPVAFAIASRLICIPDKIFAVSRAF